MPPEPPRRLPYEFLEELGEIGWVVRKPHGNLRNRQGRFRQQPLGVSKDFHVIKVAWMVSRFLLHGVGEVLMGNAQLRGDLAQFHHFRGPAFQHILQMIVHKLQIGTGNLRPARCLLVVHQDKVKTLSYKPWLSGLRFSRFFPRTHYSAWISVIDSLAYC